MDPLTALSLAGTIVQFVDFGTKILSNAHEIYNSNTRQLDVHAELDLVTTDLKALLVRFRQALSSSPDDDSILANQESDDDLQKICEGAIKVAEEIGSKLNKMKVVMEPKKNPKDKYEKERFKIWKSFSQAVRTAWSQDDLDRLIKRLSIFKDAIETRVLLRLRETTSLHQVQTTARFDSLDRQSRKIITALLSVNSSKVQAREIQEQTITLTQLLSRIEASNQAEHYQTRNLMAARLGFLTEEDSESDSNSEDAQITNKSMDVTEKDEYKLRKAVEDHILKSIRPSTLHKRYEELPDAHPQTFEWIMDKLSPQKLPWSPFTEWLERGSGVYWISGKAGSGKSTLMKYIKDEHRVRESLRIWAGGAPLCVAHFFFWNSGTTEQRSQTGLLRALLFEILAQYPELILKVMPLIWARTYSALVARSTYYNEAWSLKVLMEVFSSFLQQQTVSFKLCLFIDGLDEYDGDHNQMAELFKDVASASNVKVCLSSRPWVVFGACFQDCSTLRLQDLTMNDIEHYVRDRFSNDRAFQNLSFGEPDLAQTLVEDIVERADGVFLWVRLVVKSLLDGIRNRDTAADLRARLHLLPKELEPLYQHLLSLIDPFYLEWASKAFQLIQAARQCKFDWIQIEWPLTMVDLYLCIDNSVVTWEEAQQYSLDKMSTIYQDTQIRVTARCAGLLEFKPLSEDETRKATVVEANTSIQYLHRTARDYIERPEVWTELQKHASGFDPTTVLFKSSVLQLGMKHSRQRRAQWIWRTMCYACRVNQLTGKSHAAMIDKLVNYLESFEMFHKTYWTNDFNGHGRNGPITSFLPFAALFDLTAYVQEKLAQCNEDEANDKATSVLNHVLVASTQRAQGYQYPPPSLEMIEILLQASKGLNARHHRRETVWQNALALLPVDNLSKDHIWQQQYMNCLANFAKAGADPNVLLQYLQGVYTYPMRFQDHLASKFPKATAILLDELQNTKVPKAQVISLEQPVKRNWLKGRFRRTSRQQYS